MKCFVCELVVSISLCCSVAMGQKTNIELEHLVYCRSDVNLSKLWFIDHKQALAARRHNHSEYAIKDLVLIDHTGLIVDSVSIKQLYNRQNDYLHANIGHVLRLSSSRFIFIFGKCAYQLSVQNNKIQHQSLKGVCFKNFSLSGQVQAQYPNLLKEATAYIDGLLVGYYRHKTGKVKRNGISENDQQNFPEFWVAKLNEHHQVIEVQTINHATQEKTKDLYLDVKDWDIIWDRTNVFLPFFTYGNHKLVFNIVRGNQLGLLDTQSHSTALIDLPDLSTGDSHFYYYDYPAQQNYLVKKIQGRYQVFSVDESFNKAAYLTDLSWFPLEFVGGKAHIVKTQHENKRSFYCHYLIPLNDGGASAPLLLKQVVIKP